MKTHPLILVFTLCFVASILSGQNPVLVLPVGHASYVENARFSMDSKYIVTSSADVKIWNVESGKLIHSLETKAPFVYDANYSPDGKYIVTASHDSTSEIWDVKSGELSSSLVGHLDAIFSSSYSLDGKQILTASNDKTAKLWDSKSGKLVHSLEGHKSALEYAKFSKDQKFILTVSSDSTAKIWDRNTGKLLHTLRAPKSQLRHARFSPDTKRILTVSSDSTARIWNVNSGKLLNGFVGIKQCVFSPDGKYLLATKDNMVSAIDAQTGDLIRTFDQQIGKFGVLEFSPDGKQILTTTFDKMGKNGNAQIWDFLSGRLVRTLEEAGGGYYISSACYSPDGKFILTASNKIVRIWDSQSGKLFQTLHGHTDGVSNAIYSPDLKYIAFGSGNTLKIWDALNGKVVHSMDEHKEIISDIKYSNDGSQILTASFDGTARLWDSKNGKLLSNFNHHDKLLTNVDYRPDENIVISRATTYDFRTRKTSIETYLWDVHSQKLIHKFDGVANYSPNNRNIVVGNEKSGQIFDSQTLELNYSLEGHSGRILSASYSLDGKIVITTSEDQTVKLWDAQSGKIIRTLEGHSGNVFAPIYDSNGKTIVTRSRDKSAIIWNLQNGEVIKKLAGHRAGVTQILYSPDGQAIITVDDYSVRSWNKSTGDLLSTTELNGASFEDMDWAGRKIVATQSSSMILFNMETGKEIVRWVIIDKSDWAVTHSSGLFDASPGAMDKLYYVQGMDFIEFNQLKTRYYEPGLWKKIMIGEDLRMVENYKAISLPPDIHVSQIDNKGFLNIELTNRGAGIGEVNVFINGKEVIKDARNPNSKTEQASLSIKVFIANHKLIIKGQENYIAIKAWSADHWVVSKGKGIVYKNTEVESYSPVIHILTCGISDYTGEEIDLKFAAKDADDMSKAIQLGAKKLFGIDKCYIYNLTTSGLKQTYPTKENILKALSKISSTAHPLDIFVMYMSGHGINYGGQDGDWHYLTQDAYTANATAYNDPSIRTQTTISSNELVELFKKVPALKQVLLIDACASGKVVDNLMAKKDIESSTLRALDRMRDRTGVHIITGCTADAVSYEATKYGQGVLTYSLLEGMRGAALREDQYVDINKLFQYTQDRVPKLAEGIGGIQSPQIFSPQGSQSFDIGLLTDTEKQEIPIATIRPVYIRSNFQDENDLEDVLNLGRKVDDLLNEASSKGTDATLIFVDVREYPEGCKLVGRYKRESGKIILKLKKRCEGQETTTDFTGVDINDLGRQIIKSLNK